MNKYLFLSVLLSLGLAWSKGGPKAFQKRVRISDTVVKIVDVGDRLTNLVIPDMINYTSDILNLADFTGQCIIIDFWHTRCSTCIEAFPELEKFQKQYSGSLKIILASYQPKSLIIKFLATHKKITGQTVSLPIACGDTLLSGYFQPQTFPHYVWIDRAGVVRHITQSYDITPENIQSFVSNKSFTTGKKSSTVSDVDFSKPLFLDGNGGNSSSIIYYSVISKHVENMPSIGVYNNAGESNSTIFACESPVKEQFQYAFNDFVNGFFVPDNRTELHVRDSTKYVWKVNGVYKWDNCFEYQLIAPYRSVQQLRVMMREDLSRYFGLEAHMEKRIVKCWVMTCEDTSLLVSKGGYYKNAISTQDYSLIVRNAPDSVISMRFVYNIFYDSPFPFVSDIHMKSNIDIILEGIDYNNTDAVIKALRRYKVNIKLEDHAVNYLVISEPGYDAETRR